MAGPHSTSLAAGLFIGASSGAAGFSGLVPPPSAGQQNYVLKGDGTWVSEVPGDVTSLAGTAGQVLVNGGTAAADGALTLTLAAALTGINSLTSAASTNLTLGTGSFGTFLTATSATGAVALAAGLTVQGGATFTNGTSVPNGTGYQTTAWLVYQATSNLLIRDLTNSVTAATFTAGSATNGAFTMNGAGVFQSTTASTSTTTGSGIFGGGIGVAGNVWSAGTINTTSATATSGTTAAFYGVASVANNSFGGLIRNTHAGGYSDINFLNDGGTTLGINSFDVGLAGSTAGGSFSNYGFLQSGSAISGIRIFNGNTLAATFAGGNTTLGGSLAITGALSGVTTLAASGTVTNTATASTLAGGYWASSATPRFVLNQTGASSNQKIWDFIGLSDGTMRLRTVNDADNSAATIFEVTRSGTTVSTMTFSAAANTIGGTVNFTSATASTSTSTGALVLSGANAGLGMAGSASIGGNLGLGGNVDGNITLKVGGAVTLFNFVSGSAIDWMAQQNSQTISTGNAGVGGGYWTRPNITAGTQTYYVGYTGANVNGTVTNYTRFLAGNFAAITGNFAFYSDSTAGTWKNLDTTEATTGGAGSLTTAGGIYAAKKIISGGDAVVGGVIIESVDTRSGPGAVSVTATTTKVTTTGVLDALTLANGTEGQIKRVVHDVDGGSFILTPTTKTGFTTFTSTVIGETIGLQYVAMRGWMVIGNFGGVIA